jgi:hypothetical protein
MSRLIEYLIIYLAVWFTLLNITSKKFSSQALARPDAEHFTDGTEQRRSGRCSVQAFVITPLTCGFSTQPDGRQREAVAVLP